MSVSGYGFIVTAPSGAVCGFFETERAAERACRVAIEHAGVEVHYAEVLVAADILAVMSKFPDGVLPLSWHNLNERRRAELVEVLT